MEKEVVVYERGVKDAYSVNLGAGNTNTSDVVSSMIRATAHYCDKYQSDIYYDIKSFLDCVENGRPFDRILMFYECGVHSRNYGEEFNRFFLNHCWIDNRAFFRLSYDPEKQKQSFARLSVWARNKI